jgi:hypothetical protein
MLRCLFGLQLTAYCLKGFKKLKVDSLHQIYFKGARSLASSSSAAKARHKKFAHQARRPFPSVRQQEV